MGSSLLEALGLPATSASPLAKVPIPAAPVRAKAAKPPVNAASVNKTPGMQTFLNRLDKLSLRLNDLGLTPEQVIEMVKKNPAAAIAELNRRVDVQEVRAGQVGRTRVLTKKTVDAPHTEGGPEKTWHRKDVLGGTPSKDSPTGERVKARMRAQKKLVGVPPNEMVFHEPSGQWYPIKECDMGHTKDAVTWWEETGSKYGEKSEITRAFMTDANNYELEPGHINSSRGAKIGKNYGAPADDPITIEEMAGEVKKRPTDSPKGKSAGSTSSMQGLESEASAYSGEAAKLSKSAAALDEQAAEIKKRAAEIRHALLERRIDPDVYFKQTKAMEKEVLGVGQKRKALASEATTLQGQAESMVSRIGQTMPAELEAEFHTKNPKEILKRVRSGQKGAATMGGMLAVVGALATGYALVEGIRYVLDSDNLMEGVGRALEVGGNFAVSAAEGELLAYLAGSSGVGLALGLVINMPSDQGGASRQEEEKAQKDAEKAQAKKLKHNEMIAVGSFLEKTAPGSVQWTENFYVIHDQALWDKTVRDVHDMQAEYVANQYATQRKRAFDLGVSDGHFSLDFVRVEDIKAWPEVKSSANHLTLFLELFEDYKLGFKQGNANQQALMDRASKLGYADAKASRKRDPDQMDNWPEIRQAVGLGATPVKLFVNLYESYADAFEAVEKAPAKR